MQNKFPLCQGEKLPAAFHDLSFRGSNIRWETGNLSRAKYNLRQAFWKKYFFSAKMPNCKELQNGSELKSFIGAIQKGESREPKVEKCWGADVKGMERKK